MEQLWTQTKLILEKTVSPGLFHLWIKPLTAQVAGETLELTAPNAFVAAWVNERLLDAIAEAAASVMGKRPKVAVVAADARPGPHPHEKDRGPKAPVTIVPLGLPPAMPLRTVAEDRFRFSFDDFVVGPSNELAYVASKGICERTLASEQLFITSAPGLGKTHLLQAIGQQLCLGGGKARPRVVYLTAEEFAGRLIMAIKARDVERFKTSFRESVDVLLLEDIHFFRDKPRIQAELLNTLKALRSRGCRLVFTSSFLPKELSGVDDQLASRFCSGFLAGIEPPDLPTRKRILERKAAVHQVLLPENVSDLLAEHLRADIRQIESCIQNLALKARLLNRGISLEMAWEVLGNYKLENPTLTLDDIVDYVCDVYRISPELLSSKSRKREHVLARNTAFLLARRHTELSLQDIGQRFNRRHSTVVKGITTLERHLSLETPLGRQIEKTMERLAP
ncbi:chromosomal replication initiator protein DnaA [Desulfolutivibrio sulfoxidireducens]|uniref:chromosomal replication initiator protein DnaA n=1 Tax=Desulfolutivibrio sulfoxidireducens TaxID=2773299 RepID=UPI00159E43E7|nr:chromosomal replication initiator protein DnaA [Desulfolutivibrio sulfoxidireducens]QLA16121.1 chromosomal replication initiator protein DnaA [Desulfolutivibrio sulfoxidireducens]QLA19981.1 chromosomal replication initiator protein DnaA [Desulfolutivibrio sulfoxidireducens]